MLDTVRTASRLFLVAGGIFAISACSKDNGSQTAATSNGSTPSAASQAQGDQDLSDITKYKLSMDKIDKYIQSQRNLGAKVKSMSPAQREAFENSDISSDANASLDDMVAKIDKQPIMVAAINEAGLSTREWVMVTMSMMQTGMAAAVLKMRPNDNQDSLMREMKVNPDNVKFYNEHEAEITAKTKAVEADMKALEGDNS
jgi:hypothetical protein